MTILKRSLEAAINCASYGWDTTDWYFFASPVDLDLGHITADTYKQGNALRFLNIDIPPGQVIKNAYITYFSWGTYNVDYCYGHIYGEKSLTPTPFSTWADFEARPKTTNRIPWDQIPHWETNKPYDTPNIASVIQEIISQPGWVSGSPIALFCDDLDNRSSQIFLATRHAWAYYEHFEWAPVLTIEYGPETQIAVLDISYLPTPDTVIIILPTQIPCHLTCYYTDKKPVRHATTRVVRGLALPWGAYWCFVAWKSIEQQEAGDTLTHTFEVPDWSHCQTNWFTFSGTTRDIKSPSVGPLFEYHHPGIHLTSLFLRPNAQGDLWNSMGIPAQPANSKWKNVDDIIPDEDTSYNYLAAWPRSCAPIDLYHIEDPAFPLQLIHSITQHARFKINDPTATFKSAGMPIKTHGTVYYYTGCPFLATVNWEDYQHTWTENPNTHSPWTWQEIHDLQIGLALFNPKRPTSPWIGKWTACTQTYLEVVYYT